MKNHETEAVQQLVRLIQSITKQVNIHDKLSMKRAQNIILAKTFEIHDLERHHPMAWQLHKLKAQLIRFNMCPHDEPLRVRAAKAKVTERINWLLTHLYKMNSADRVPGKPMPFIMRMYAKGKS